MTTRSKHFDLEHFEGDDTPYSALCRLCLWADEFTSKRAARAAFIRHDCVRELPELPTDEVDGWRWDARCTDPSIDADIFFEPSRYDDAIATCNVCTVRSSCLCAALREEQRFIPWGVRGGLLPEERIALADVTRG